MFPVERTMSFLMKCVRSPAPPLREIDWRSTNFTERDKIIEEIRALRVSTNEITNLHILLLGPVGSGKSSFINSIDSIFQNRMTCGAAVDGKSDESFTKMYQTHRIKNGRYGEYLPFVISDTMGLQQGYDKGLNPKDAVEALQGHIKEGHKFNQQRGEREVSSATLDDRIHCLVMLLPARKMTMVRDEVITKMRDVRERATELKIPQVVLLTKIDETCPEVQKDIKLVYRSEKINKKMEVCSNRLGVPMNCIFPVKNYHKESKLNNDMDVLLLSALKNILKFANDHVAEIPQTED